MRKLVWGGVALCLAAGALGVFWATKMQSAIPVVVESTWEEQEPVVPIAAAEPSRNLTPRDAVEVIEPIVVEDVPSEPPPAPQFGGGVLPGQGVRVIALGPDQPPRPDEEPGEEQRMPYAGDLSGLPGLTQLWDAVCRVLAGPDAAPGADIGTSEEQAEPEMPRLPVPVFDYHRNEMHCPFYSGRCVIPSYPVPPPAAPPSK